jgi:hypothetical protein
METVTDYSGSSKRILPEHDPADLSACSGLRVQGSAQVRAATAQVQRRKWTWERSSFGADYMGNFEGDSIFVTIISMLKLI